MTTTALRGLCEDCGRRTCSKSGMEKAPNEFEVRVPKAEQVCPDCGGQRIRYWWEISA